MSKFGTYQLPRENFAASAIARIEGLMVQEHWVFVKEVTLYSQVYRIWKSPAAFNSANRDFYLCFDRSTSITATGIFVRTFLGFDPGNNTMSGYHINATGYDTTPLTSPTWRPADFNKSVALNTYPNEGLPLKSSDLLWTRVTPDFVHAFVGSSQYIIIGGLYTPAADYSEWLTAKGFREDFIPLCQGPLRSDYPHYLFFSTSSVGNPSFNWYSTTGREVARIGGTPSDITQPGRLSRYPLASLYALRHKDSVTGAFVDIGYLPSIVQVYVPITGGRGDKVDITIGTFTETYVIATDGGTGYRLAMSTGQLED